MKYILQPIFALIGGVLLIIVNAVGDPGIYAQMVSLLTSYGYISPETGETAKNVLYFIAYLGGGSVLIGGLIYLTDRARIASFFISVGAGISISILAMRAIALGPVLKQALDEGGVLEFISVLMGASYGLWLLGTLFAFLALLTYYVPLILAGIASIGYLASGATLNIQIESILPEYASVAMAGIAILIIGLIGALGHVKICRLLSALVLILYIPTLLIRIFTGTLDRKTLAFSLIAIIFTVLLIARKPGGYKRIMEKILRRRQ